MSSCVSGLCVLSSIPPLCFLFPLHTSAFIPRFYCVYCVALRSYCVYHCVNCVYCVFLRSLRVPTAFHCVSLRSIAFHFASLRSVCSVALPTDHYCVYFDSVVFALRSLRSPCVPTVSRLFILVFPSLPCCSTVFLQLPCAFYHTWDSEAPHPLIVHSLAHS